MDQVLESLAIFNPAWWADKVEGPAVRKQLVVEVDTLKACYATHVDLVGGGRGSPLVSANDLSTELGSFMRCMLVVCPPFLRRKEQARSRARAAAAAAAAGGLAAESQCAGDPESDSEDRGGAAEEDEPIATDLWASMVRLGHTRNFPAYARLAKLSYTIVSTSVEDERTFSIAGFLFNDLRSSMSAEHLDQWLRLYKSRSLYPRLNDFPAERVWEHWDKEKPRRGARKHF